MFNIIIFINIIMKNALLIAGYLRSIKLNIEKIYNFIIQNYDFDIFIHLTIDENNDKYSKEKIDINNIIDKLNPKLIIQEKNILFSENKHLNNIKNANYKFYLLNQNKNMISKSENIEYNIVVKIRPDLHLYEKLDYNLINNNIIIPTNSLIDHKKLDKEDKYICDILAYGNSELMDKYFDYFNYIDNLIVNHNYNNNTILSNENILYNYLNKYNINYKCVDISFIVILSKCNTIAICGDSSTGKSLLSQYIKENINNSFILECDRYHKWERNSDNWKKYSHLNLEANYITKMQNDVFDIFLGNDIYQVDYDHSTGKFTDLNCIKSTDNFIITGLHTLYNDNSILNLKIFMEVEENLRVAWKILRDSKKRNKSVKDILDSIDARKNDYIKYILPQKYKSDIHIYYYIDNHIDISKININQEFNENIKYKLGLNNNNINIEKIIKMLINYNYSINYKNNFVYLKFDDHIKIFEIILLIIKNYNL